jgi:hypothetical protein
MPGLVWSLSNFRLGVHTNPSEQNQSDLFAYDAKNVKSDADGTLVNRYAMSSVKAAGGTVTGLAVEMVGSVQCVFYLLDTGELKLLVLGGLDVSLVTDANLTGKLSSLKWSKDIVFITSQGADQGYYIDLSAFVPPGVTTATIFQLGITPVDASGINALETTGGAMATGFYYYRFTYIRHVDDLADTAPLRGTIDNLHESNPATDIIEEEVTGGNNAIDISLMPVSADPQVTRKGIFRSTVQAAALLASQQADLTYYFVADVTNATTLYSDTFADASITGNRTLRTDNDRLPSSVTSITLHADRVFAASSDELRYSDIRSADLLPWAFPMDNNVRQFSEVEFCTTYRGVVLFGGPNGVYRLTGTSAFDFDVDEISTVGPLDSGAWGVDKTLVYWVGVNGLYACDGVQVQRIDDALERYFFDMQTKAGSVVAFPNKDVLFIVYADLAAGGTATYGFLRKDTGAWEKWEDINVLQGFPVVTTSLVDGEKTWDEYIVEDSGTEIREILWDRTGITTDGGGSAISWAWHSQWLDWESSGLAEKSKYFRWLEIEVEADITLTVQHTVNTSTVSQSWNVKAITNTRPFRIPINKRGERIQIKVSGTGSPRIRAMRLIGSYS